MKRQDGFYPAQLKGDPEAVLVEVWQGSIYGFRWGGKHKESNFSWIGENPVMLNSLESRQVQYAQSFVVQQRCRCGNDVSIDFVDCRSRTLLIEMLKQYSLIEKGLIQLVLSTRAVEMKITPEFDIHTIPLAPTRLDGSYEREAIILDVPGQITKVDETGLRGDDEGAYEDVDVIENRLCQRVLWQVFVCGLTYFKEHSFPPKLLTKRT